VRIPATKAKCLCDKCGEEVEVERYGVAATEITVAVNNAWWNRGGDTRKFEFCQKCWRSVYNEVIAVLTRK